MVDPDCPCTVTPETLDKIEQRPACAIRRALPVTVSPVGDEGTFVAGRPQWENGRDVGLDVVPFEEDETAGN